MKYHELQVVTVNPKGRVGRGIAAGQGKTAGRGTKGQNSRAGKGKRPGFEGGQNPLMQRLPKLRGFRSGRPETQAITTAQLNALTGKVDNFTVHKAGLTTSPYVRVKVITGGELKAKLTVTLQGASESSKAAIQKAGGTFAVIARPKQPVKNKS